jgi:DNA helicase-2/ATP-dependent DNA helicase PcrA
VLRGFKDGSIHLVDEFQDTNYAQFELVKLLAGEERNITVVGDDDQSIYKFRGAAISNILGFVDCFPDAKQIVLTTNYRSPQSCIMLDCRHRLVRFNNPDELEVRNAVDKRLAAVKGEGRPPRHLHFDAVSAEADSVANVIAEKVEAGEYGHKDFAILVRSNNDADPFLRALNMRGIPHRFSGSRGLYGREEIKLLISFLRAVSKFDDSVSLYYLAGSEIYDVAQADLVRLNNFARRRNLSLHDVLELLAGTAPEGGSGSSGHAAATTPGASEHGAAPEGGTVPSSPDRGSGAPATSAADLPQVSEASLDKARRLMSDVEKYVGLARTRSAGEVLRLVHNRYRLLGRLSQEESPIADEKIKNIAKFFDLLRNFGSVALRQRVQNFVEHLDMLTEAGDGPPWRRPTSTRRRQRADGAQGEGLGIQHRFMVRPGVAEVYVPREEQIELPALVKDILPSGDFHIQEERRLFYVGMTRAREELYLTTARDYGGARPKKISQFVMEAMDLPKTAPTPFKSSAIEVIQRSAGVEPVLTVAQPMPPEETLTLAISDRRLRDLPPQVQVRAHTRSHHGHHAVVYEAPFISGRNTCAARRRQKHDPGRVPRVFETSL